ncbi:hypothetical protein TNCV_1916551 [Trichonephila clavipes]|uniref:Uncharacterized protein n=1 Tax=Trichonephila clavipes TaxID=2585209 RepID=A0A8X7BBH7_TRICX|nr:hypothetical protein TNCV_1916551 [Trichonephila clavipes]
MEPKYTHLQSSQLGVRFTSNSARISSGSHFPRNSSNASTSTSAGITSESNFPKTPQGFHFYQCSYITSGNHFPKTHQKASSSTSARITSGSHFPITPLRLPLHLKTQNGVHIKVFI